MQADGGTEVLVEAQDVWIGRAVQERWKKVKGQWRAGKQATVRRDWNKDMERMGDGEPWLLLAMFGQTCIALY